MTIDKLNCSGNSLVSSRPLFAGAVVGFLAACVLGRLASKQNLFPGYQRLYGPINHLSLFYPTASQFRAVVRARMTPDRVAVILGGSSVFLGSGHGIDHLWSKQLQARLGERYRVFNFATHSGGPAELGATVAEMASKDYPKVLLVTCCFARGAEHTDVGDPDGQTQPYFFWDAYYKGLLPPYPARDARLKEIDRAKGKDESYRELKLRCRLDSLTYCQDLWTTFSYRYATTVFCPGLKTPFTLPRKRYPDEEPPMPSSFQHQPNCGGAGMAFLETMVPSNCCLAPTDGAAAPDYRDGRIVRSMHACFPERFRKRTLVVFTHYNPFFVKQLPLDQQASYACMFPQTVRAMEQGGYSAMELGKGYTEGDYYDACHFSSHGAERMAADVAPQVRQLATELGYLSPE